jgi:hypothetical protein
MPSLMEPEDTVAVFSTWSALSNDALAAAELESV